MYRLVLIFVIAIGTAIGCEKKEDASHNMSVTESKKRERLKLSDPSISGVYWLKEAGALYELLDLDSKNINPDVCGEVDSKNKTLKVKFFDHNEKYTVNMEETSEGLVLFKYQGKVLDKGFFNLRDKYSPIELRTFRPDANLDDPKVGSTRASKKVIPNHIKSFRNAYDCEMDLKIARCIDDIPHDVIEDRVKAEKACFPKGYDNYK
ncbi:hypothetical protein JWG44_21855 [Leptospira sp. 201903071]|uniref:hypothetical protein n=1 Tax=Leptospira ainazelensis TaxID=2810034 RepID=UPI001962BAB0|nr:hypothetical protein [Leptospira ainazelensis]MBM9502901.1 hypothetical protein [Leptospira ainazelensis]